MVVAALLASSATGAARGQTTGAPSAPPVAVADSTSIPAPADTVAVTLTRPAVAPAVGPHRDAPWKVMMRSLALPGWGQLYNHQYVKAGLAIAAEGGLIGTYIVYDHKSRTTDDSTLAADDRNVRQAALWFGAAVTLVSMLDAYVDAHLYKFREHFTPIDVRLTPLPGAGAAVAVAATF